MAVSIAVAHGRAGERRLLSRRLYDYDTPDDIVEFKTPAKPYLSSSSAAGLTGLSTALFLAWHGVKPLLVERHPDLLIHPRARGFTPTDR